MGKARLVLGPVVLMVLAATVAVGLHMRVQRHRQAWVHVVPRYSPLSQRIRGLHPLRKYRLPHDPTATASEAGIALHAVEMAGETLARDRFREPTPALATSWLPDPAVLGRTSDDRFAELDPSVLFPAAASGLDDARRTVLEQIASHPGVAEFGKVTRAREADLLSARYVMPFDSSADYYSLEIPPSWRVIKEASYVFVARAALALEAGRREDAETSIREIISFGFLLLDEATNMIDAITGFAVVRVGYEALMQYLLVIGELDEAESLASLDRWFSVDTAKEQAERTSPAVSPEDLRRTVYDIVRDSTENRGLRWEATLNTMEMPCFTVTELVLGASKEHRQVLDAAWDGLVRRESDAEYFRLLEEAARRRHSGVKPCSLQR
jgi:hypothetical protein